VTRVLAPSTQTSPDEGRIRVLFDAARRRRRRRLRLTGIVMSLVLAAGASAVAVTFSRQSGSPVGSRPAGAARAGSGPGGPRSPLVAWFDYGSRLHVGDLATRAQRVVTEADADPSTPMAEAGGRVYWINVGTSFQFVQALDLATGKISDLGLGQSVFPSADGQRIFIAEANSVTEVPAAGGAGRQLSPPPGWYLPGDGTGGPLDQPMAVAGGILVQSSPAQARPVPVTLADWDVRTGHVTVLGRVISADFGVIGVSTPPGSGPGLVAWVPPACRIWCAIRIASTSTDSGPTLRSPLGHGFALGGAFSPDGRQLAVFVNRTPGQGGEWAQLAIANSRTGALRLVPGVRIVVGEAVSWARWLPGGRQLIVAGLRGSYLVNAATRSAKPFTFRHDRSGPNYSAVIVPPAARPARR
jgi:hypothetical protein